MPYVTSIQRLDRCDGIRLGIASLLRGRFGKDADKLLPEIHEIYEEERLLAIHQALVTAASPDDVRLLCSPSGS